jgi:hemolysin III
MIGGATFGLAALLLFATSTLYHASRDERSKKLFRKLDHAAIYVLIAGSYTAFALSVLRGYWGWALFAAIWVAAACGIAAEFSHRAHRPIRSSVIYIAMGWVGLVAIKPLIANLTPEQLKWLVAGGLLYTAGVPFYVWKSRPYTHVLWHIFVIAGVACHFMAVLSVMHQTT